MYAIKHFRVNLILSYLIFVSKIFQNMRTLRIKIIFKKSCDNNDDNLIKKSKSVFQLKWLHIEEFKY